MEPTNMHSSNRFQNGVLSGALQRFQNLLKALGLRDSVQPTDNRAVATDTGHMHARPSDLHTEHADSDSKLRGGIRGFDYADPSFNLPESVYKSRMGSMDDKPKHLRQVGHKPNQPNESGESTQPCERHVCRLNPRYTCACPGDTCANDDATYRHARGPFTPTEQQVRAPEPNALGNFRCPVSGKLCSSFVCRDWCEGSGSGTTLNNDRCNATPTYNSGNT